jgi:hypothetical protein
LPPPPTAAATTTNVFRFRWPYQIFKENQFLALLDILANIIIDFTAGNLSRSGWIVTAVFFCCCFSVYYFTSGHCFYKP